VKKGNGKTSKTHRWQYWYAARFYSFLLASICVRLADESMPFVRGGSHLSNFSASCKACFNAACGGRRIFSGQEPKSQLLDGAWLPM